jgi:predicted dehydrogenase
MDDQSAGNRSDLRRIRYGVIGIKGIGQHHIRLAQQHQRVELVALVDTDETCLRETSARLGTRGFANYREMLDAGLVEAVSIATPHHLLGPIGLACLNAGIHIFVEKPFAIRISEAEAMVAAARARGLKICVGYQYRTYRTFRAMKELIDDGTLGHIQRVLWTWAEFRPEPYFRRTPWRTTWRQAGGGVLMNQASHDVDLLCWLLGQPLQVTALLGRQLHQAEVEDIVCASVLFADGVMVTFQATINQPRGYSVRQIAGDKGLLVIPNVQSLTHDVDDEMLLGAYPAPLSNLVGSLPGHHDQPQITWRTLCPPGREAAWRRWARKRPALRWAWDAWRAVRATRWRGERPRSERLSGHAALLDSFVDAILDGGEPLVSGESALPAVELGNAMIFSAIRGRTVKLPLDRAAYDQLFEALSQGDRHVS